MSCPSCQVLINGDLKISSKKPRIEEILKTTVKPVIRKTVIIKGKVIVRGTIKIGIEYVGRVCNESQPVHFAHLSKDFDCFIDVSCAKPGMKAKVYAEVEFFDVIVVSGRVVSILVIVKVTLVELYYDDYDCCTEEVQCNIIDNCHSSNDACKPHYKESYPHCNCSDGNNKVVHEYVHKFGDYSYHLDHCTDSEKCHSQGDGGIIKIVGFHDSDLKFKINRKHSCD